jgi:transcription termination factor Rho
MKRTGIFGLAAACALGVTALVGGVGYASALDVAEQQGQTLDVPGVSTVEKTSDEVAKSTDADKTKSTPTPAPTDPAAEAPVAAPPVVEGTDQGSGAVDEVDPSDPVVIPDDGTKDPDGKGCGKGDHDGDWADKADDGVVDPAEGDGAWTGDKDWSGDWTQKDDQWTGDPAPAPAPADPNTNGDGNWRDGNRDGGDRSDRGGGDRSDRGGDRGQRGGGHGHGGGGHQGGRG